jgi:hypothetical protein
MPIKRALEPFRKKQAAEPENARQVAPFLDAPAPAPSPPPMPDEFYLALRCAVTGFYFRALYGCAPGGMFIPKTGFMKVESAHADAKGLAAGPPPQIPASAVSTLRDPCPWCGGKLVHNYVRCTRCERLVCMGRSYLDGGAVIFVCHEDCGLHAPVSSSYITSYGVEPKAPPGPALPPAAKHPALPAASKQPGQSLALPGKGRAVRKN